MLDIIRKSEQPEHGLVGFSFVTVPASLLPHEVGVAMSDAKIDRHVDQFV